MDQQWLLLVYRLPPEPSRNRVAVWRRLRKLGAVYMETGAWALPFTETLSSAVAEIAEEIRRLGGDAAAFTAQSLDTGQEDELRTRFNRMREEEYRNVLRECTKFLSHMDREVREKQFEPMEVEELEEDLEKIENWFAKVRQRDVFGVPLRAAVEEQLQMCGARLGLFIQETYERGTDGNGLGESP